MSDYPTDDELDYLRTIRRGSGQINPRAEKSCEAHGWASEGKLTPAGEEILEANKDRKSAAIRRRPIGRR